MVLQQSVAQEFASLLHIQVVLDGQENDYRILDVEILTKKITYSGNHITRKPPRGDDLYIWLEAIEGKLETNLIVPFACATM